FLLLLGGIIFVRGVLHVASLFDSDIIAAVVWSTFLALGIGFLLYIVIEGLRLLCSLRECAQMELWHACAQPLAVDSAEAVASLKERGFRSAMLFAGG